MSERVDNETRAIREQIARYTKGPEAKQPSQTEGHFALGGRAKFTTSSEQGANGLGTSVEVSIVAAVQPPKPARTPAWRRNSGEPI